LKNKEIRLKLPMPNKKKSYNKFKQKLKWQLLRSMKLNNNKRSISKLSKLLKFK